MRIPVDYKPWLVAENSSSRYATHGVKWKREGDRGTLTATNAQILVEWDVEADEEDHQEALIPASAFKAAWQSRDKKSPTYTIKVGETESTYWVELTSKVTVLHLNESFPDVDYIWASLDKPEMYLQFNPSLLKSIAESSVKGGDAGIAILASGPLSPYEVRFCNESRVRAILMPRTAHIENPPDFQGEIYKLKEEIERLNGTIAVLRTQIAEHEEVI